jgi:hypothetical protein
MSHEDLESIKRRIEEAAYLRTRLTDSFARERPKDLPMALSRQKDFQ